MGEIENVLSQRPSFQWRGSCGLQSAIMISMELVFSKCSICSFQLVRTSEIQLAVLEGVEVGERVLDEFGG